MQTIRSGEELADSLAELRRGGTVALVPTMGALHAGHIALIQEAKRQADRVVATIFVNPTQFGPGEDLDRYPRREEADAQMLEAAGCDLLWTPAVDDIYPPGFSTRITVFGVSDRWEGEARPGHFDGVATVVAKLLLSIRPDVAVFGEKDFQQLAVIRQMVRDLAIGVTIIGIPTVRDADGLALSSRNAYLSAEDRHAALGLPHALSAARAAILDDQRVEDVLVEVIDKLDRAGFTKVDYVALVDAQTLEPMAAPLGTMRLIAAATIAGTRLIDNLAVEKSA